MTIENNETPSAFGGGGGAATNASSVSSSAASEDIVELLRRRESPSATTEGSQSQVRAEGMFEQCVSDVRDVSEWHFVVITRSMVTVGHRQMFDINVPQFSPQF